MPGFRAINKPSESPVRSTAGEGRLSGTVSRPKGDMEQVRPSVVVPLVHKSDLKPDVTEAPRKKKKNSNSSTSKPRRKQAAREKKVMYSIEYTPRKSTGSPTSRRGNYGADDSDFVPSKADLAVISMSSASNTPTRRSPRKNPSKFRLSLQASSAHAATRPERLPSMVPGTTARPPSPSLSSSRLRRQELYKRDEFVEILKDVFERKKRRKERRIKKEARMAERRQKKVKAAEQRPSEETCESRQKMAKRKAESHMERNKPHKRHKSKKSEKPRSEDPAYDDRDSSEAPKPGKQRSFPWLSESNSTEEKVQRYRPVPVKAEDRSDTPDPSSKMGIEVRSTSSKKKKVQPSSQASAEAVSSASGRKGRAQSSIPPPVFYGKRSGYQPYPGTGGSSGSGLRSPQDRSAQSKTLPVRNRDQTTRTHDAALVNQPSKFAELNKACTHSTPSHPSPLGQRRAVGARNHPYEDNNSTGQENVGARQILKILPEASSILDRPERSFDAQRRRHQSAPVNALSRNTRVDERIHLGASAPQQHNNVLQELSNNTIVQRMEQRMDEFQKAMLERLPTTAPTQVDAAGPVVAPAPRTAAPAQGVNGVEQSPAVRNTRRLSHAERLLKFPKYDRNVPQHLRHTEDEIIVVGRIVNWYERHKSAPEAFGWGHGRLFTEYNHLLNRSVNGVPVWKPEEIRRLTQ